MNIAAYCRVSTDKDDQLNSLNAQKQFFREYAKKHNHTLVKLYADEGISGTKAKNRKEFLKMLEDAEKGDFQILVVKDISRLARNTVDLLQSIRKLKSLGIETRFLTANMNTFSDSEFMLTVFGALAQEESANTSKRVKFGKRLNAEKGKVPNFVFGYDKIHGDYFNLKINTREANTVQEIFRWYIHEGLGAYKIAQRLNSMNNLTKRGSLWNQSAVCRILSNPLYTGKIINSKEEVADFLTGKRKKHSQSQWLVSMRPELAIISEEDFNKAQLIKAQRNKKFHKEKERHSNTHLFSTLIKCKECGSSFRRIKRTYKNTYISWVCSNHSKCSGSLCENKIYLSEKILKEKISEYFFNDLKTNNSFILKKYHNRIKKEFMSDTKTKELKAELKKQKAYKEKYIELFADDIITKDELNKKMILINRHIASIEAELNSTNITRLTDIFQKELSDIMQSQNILDIFNNHLIKKIIDKIEVDRIGNVKIYIKNAKTSPLCNNHT